MSERTRTLGALALLTAMLPVNAAVTAAALLRRRRPHHAAASGRTVLISGGKMTKALTLARAFDAAGHRVVLVEMAKYRLTGHRFSRAVDAFHVVPAPEDPGYAQALLDIVRREGVDVYVPVCSPAASVHDAEARAVLAGHCEVVHADAGTVRMLDDKFAFSQAADALGLGVPEHHRIEHPGDLADAADSGGGPYVLKSIPYDPVNRLDLTPLPRPTRAQTEAFANARTISPEKPWILQGRVDGREFCTHSTARDGRLRVHVCCPSSAFQLNYAAIDKPEIDAWVQRFVAAHDITGQVSFDFIETPDGRLQAIECNPRTHSAITLFDGHPDLARAYLEDGADTIRPLGDSRPTYWLYQELWRLVAGHRPRRETLRVIREGRDAIFAWNDPLPFLAVHHLQIPRLLLGKLRTGTPWVRVDFNIGKLVEPAGD